MLRTWSSSIARSPEESLSWLQSTLTSYDMFGLGQLAVLRKSDGRLIGRCGLSDLIVEIRPAGARSVEPGTPGAWFQRAQAPAGIEVQFERELGYTFERAVWGHGYATEAAGRVFDYACNVLRLPRVVSLIHADNTRSLRVAQRFGAQREDTVDVLGRSFDRYVWPSARLP